MIPKATLDTNVLVSATFWTGDSFKILDLVDKKKVKSVSSKPIIEEYDRVIKSDEIIEKIENKDLIVSKVIQNVLSNSTIVDPKRQVTICEDPDDNKFLEAAVEGKVDFIVSQDKHLLKIKEFEGIKIVTPKEFLREYE